MTFRTYDARAAGALLALLLGASPLAQAAVVAAFKQHKPVAAICHGVLLLARRDGTPMSVLLLDADHFKPVNDQFGHAVGDELLRHLAQRLRNAVRSSDIVCRIGGDEFLVICPRSNLHGAVRAAQKILDSQEPFLTAQAQPCWDGSLSIGIAEVDAAMLHTEDLLKRADRALYEAKQKGGSRAMTS